MDDHTSKHHTEDNEAQQDGQPAQLPPKPVNPEKKFKFKGKYPPGGPKIIRAELERLGYTWCPPSTPNSICQIIWAMRVEKDEWKTFRPTQKVSFLPAMPEICWKHKLHLNLNEFKSRFGSDAAPFWPRGCVLPQEDALLRQTLRDAASRGELCPIIMKPSLNAMGTGIECVTNEAELDKYLAVDHSAPHLHDSQLKQVILAQHYIMNPLTLDGFKVSFRIYVVISSLAPLRAYVFPRGLCRISSRRYTTDAESFQNIYIHLTNVDINKHNIDEFLTSKNPDLPTDGLRSNLEYVFGRLRSEGKDVDIIWARMKECIAKTLLAVEHKIGPATTNNVPFRGMGFEILGYDFLIDSDLQPWLLEINHGPNLEPHTELENDIKAKMVRDAIQTVDITRRDSMHVSTETDRLWARLQARLQNGETVPDIGGEPAHTLLRGDIYCCVDREFELTRRGAFEPVFDEQSSEGYLQYLLPQSRATRISLRVISSGRTIEELINAE